MSPLFFVIFFLAAVGYANGMFKKIEMKCNSIFM